MSGFNVFDASAIDAVTEAAVALEAEGGYGEDEFTQMFDNVKIVEGVVRGPVPELNEFEIETEDEDNQDTAWNWLVKGMNISKREGLEGLEADCEIGAIVVGVMAAAWGVWWKMTGRV
jgi:hypothetical protein